MVRHRGVAARITGGLITVGFRTELLSGPLSVWLDHFRWISALVVVLGHLRGLLFPAAGEGGLAVDAFYFITLFHTEAVAVFFVLSGLLVGGAVIRQVRGDRFVVRRYAIDRTSRLYAVLIPALFLSEILRRTVGSIHCQDSGGLIDVATNAAFLQNFGFPPLCNNAPLWSLSSEGYFYLIAPALLAALIKPSWRRILLAAVLLLPSLLVLSANHTTPAAGLLVWSLGIVPWFVRLRVPAWLAALTVAVVLLLARAHFLPNLMVQNTALAVAFTVLLCSDFQTVRAIFAPAAKALAGFSYSLYLIHMPIAEAITSAIDTLPLSPAAPASFLVYAGALLLIIGVSWAFGWLFESRTHAIRAWLDRTLWPAPVGTVRLAEADRHL